MCHIIIIIINWATKEYSCIFEPGLFPLIVRPALLWASISETSFCFQRAALGIHRSSVSSVSPVSYISSSTRRLCVSVSSNHSHHLHLTCPSSQPEYAACNGATDDVAGHHCGIKVLRSI